MKFTLVIHEDVHGELKSQYRYLDRCRSGLGNVFLADYADTLRILENIALASPTRRKKYRHIPIGRFSILIIYQVIANEVHIKRIIHTARKQNSRYRKP